MIHINVQNYLPGIIVISILSLEPETVSIAPVSRVRLQKDNTCRDVITDDRGRNIRCNITLPGNQSVVKIGETLTHVFMSKYNLVKEKNQLSQKQCVCVCVCVHV